MSPRVTTSTFLWIACVMLAYTTWAGFWIGLCVYPIGEECISAVIVLYVTGFPGALLAELFGGGLDHVVAAAVLGTMQWGAVATLLLRWRRARGSVPQG